MFHNVFTAIAPLLMFALASHIGQVSDVNKQYAPLNALQIKVSVLGITNVNVSMATTAIDANLLEVVLHVLMELQLLSINASVKLDMQGLFAILRFVPKTVDCMDIVKLLIIASAHQAGQALSVKFKTAKKFLTHFVRIATPPGLAPVANMGLFSIKISAVRSTLLIEACEEVYSPLCVLCNQ